MIGEIHTEGEREKWSETRKQPPRAKYMHSEDKLPVSVSSTNYPMKENKRTH